jgi:hypothetical protein
MTECSQRSHMLQEGVGSKSCDSLVIVVVGCGLDEPLSVCSSARSLSPPQGLSNSGPHNQRHFLQGKVATVQS